MFVIVQCGLFGSREDADGTCSAKQFKGIDDDYTAVPFEIQPRVYPGFRIGSFNCIAQSLPRAQSGLGLADADARSFFPD